MYQGIPEPPPDELQSTNPDNTFMEKEAFVIVDAFFKKHGITSQQIESFNDFVDNGIPKILDDIPEIVIEDYDNRTTHFFKIHSEGRVFKRPTFTEKDVTESDMYPNTARLRNITYAGELSVKVKHGIQREGKLRREVKGDSKQLRKIGRIPIMVMSKGCRLSDLTSEKEFESLRECSMDPGGYFIIDGKERVVLTQERAANNTPFVFRKYAHSKSVLECEIRSAVENTSASASAFWLKLLEQQLPIDKKMGLWKDLDLTSKTFIIKIKFPGLSADVHLHVFYQAIGFKTPESVYESIADFCARQPLAQEEESLKSMLPFLVPSLAEWTKMTMEEAREAIGALYTRTRNDSDNYDRDSDDIAHQTHEERRRFVEVLLQKNFLPHLGMESEGSCLRKKGLYLSYMVWKLLMVFTGQIPHDDRDHLQNKRYQCSGPLLGQLFHRSLHALKQEMEKCLRNQFRKGEIDLNKAISPTLMTNMLKHCLSTGNWGSLREMQSKNSRIYSNVTQQLNRYTRNSHLSSLRRLNSPVDKLHLMTKPRQLHNTYFGVICPSETPEGAPIGLVKHLALLAQITVSFPIEKVIEFLFRQESVVDLELGIQSKLYRKGLTKIFVDGTWIGFTTSPAQLVKKFKLARKRGQLSPYVSICWESGDGAITIRADAGRLCRPLLVAKNNRLRIKQTQIAQLKSGELRWDDLIQLGLVEIIDVAESESTLIAMNLNQLKSVDVSKTWTHMEIHPALMLGVCGSTIPFANHTQSPRIVYQAGIAKQAMGIYGTNLFSRMDASNHFLHYGHRPIVQSKSMKYFNFDEVPAGSVCTVAICCYSGYNQEDSIVLNRSAVERGLFRSTWLQSYQEKADTRERNKELEGELFAFPSDRVTKGVRLVAGGGGGIGDENKAMQLYKNIGMDGLPSPGDRVGYEPVTNIKLRKLHNHAQDYDDSEQQAIIGKVRILSQVEREAHSRQLSRRDAQGRNIIRSPFLYQDASMFERKPMFSCIDSVMVTNNSEAERLVKVRVRKHLQPQVGDKFASLHGQKGVVGMDYHEVDMPFTSQGIMPDIIMNPHGLPSRMTVGQLYESLYGKAGALEGRIMDGTPFHGRNLHEVYRLLEKHGFRRDGTEVMYDGRTGRKIYSPVFIGPTYYQRLKHLVDDKIHSRARGQLNILTQQPVKGFSRDGGLRFGEMERDCLITHGCAVLLMERLMDVSDSRKIPICGGCGFIAWNRPLLDNKGYNVCVNCVSSNPNDIRAPQIYTVRMPYAAKLFFQELMCMNIAPRIMPADAKKATDCDEYENIGTGLYTAEDPISLSELRKIANIPSASSLEEERRIVNVRMGSCRPTGTGARPVVTGMEDIKSYGPRPYDETSGEED